MYGHGARHGTQTDSQSHSGPRYDTLAFYIRGVDKSSYLHVSIRSQVLISSIEQRSLRSLMFRRRLPEGGARRRGDEALLLTHLAQALHAPLGRVLGRTAHLDGLHRAGRLGDWLDEELRCSESRNGLSRASTEWGFAPAAPRSSRRRPDPSKWVQREGRAQRGRGVLACMIAYWRTASC